MSKLSHFAALNLAIQLVKKAGFELVCVAMNSESCYYFHPARGRRYLLRLSTHKSKGTLSGLTPPVAAMTFSPKDTHHNQLNVRNRIAFAVGIYFLADEPKPNYDGPLSGKQNREMANHLNEPVVNQDAGLLQGLPVERLE